MRWKIWFDLYNGNMKIGSGVWHQSYTRKHNAVRAAKRMFNRERINKYTGKVYTYKWIVSQGNPRLILRGEEIYENSRCR